MIFGTWHSMLESRRCPGVSLECHDFNSRLIILEVSDHAQQFVSHVTHHRVDQVHRHHGKLWRLQGAGRETSTQAKELFKDAEAAQKFYSKFKKETKEIEWYQRPTGPQCCTNFKDCGCAEAMFWCHPCGLAFCLECRTNGLACDHNIINYSSELSSDFLPDSIGSTKSPFDIGVLIDAV